MKNVEVIINKMEKGIIVRNNIYSVFRLKIKSNLLVTKK